MLKDGDLINKQLFKLYWCLEALNYFYEYIDNDLLYKILLKSVSREDYTIREKVAQLVISSNRFADLKTMLSEDENYYVRKMIKSF